MTWTATVFSIILSYFLFKIQTLTFCSTAGERFVQTHSLGPSFPDGFQDGFHVEVAFTGGSGANTHSLVRHLHVNLKRHTSALADAPSKKNYHHLQIHTTLQWLFHVSFMESDFFLDITMEQISSGTILTLSSLL